MYVSGRGPIDTLHLVDESGLGGDDVTVIAHFAFNGVDTVFETSVFEVASGPLVKGWLEGGDRLDGMVVEGLAGCGCAHVFSCYHGESSWMALDKIRMVIFARLC